MGKGKIILFLSTMKEDAKENEYLCPKGKSVRGKQTNEAPVKYLLREYKEIREVICILTQEAEKTAWEHFQKVVANASRNLVKCIPIPFTGDEDDFTQKIIPEVIDHMDSGDTIYLETSGGPRNAVMDILLLSRILSYAGHVTKAAVYSSFGQEKRIVDCSHLISMFDLVGGMQEFTSFGNMRTLQKYYDSQKKVDAKMDSLLKSLEQLSENIALCRGSQIESSLEEFNDGMDDMLHQDQWKNPLMKVMLTIFRKKFGRHMPLPDLLQWCVENDLLQQALTLYRELVPEYMTDSQNKMVTLEDSALERYRLEKSNNNLSDARLRKNHFRDHFCGISDRMYGSDTLGQEIRAFNNHIKEKGYTVQCNNDEQLHEIMLDFNYIRILRNMVNHSGDRPDLEKVIKHLKRFDRIVPDHLDASFVKKELINAIKHLKCF